MVSNVQAESRRGTARKLSDREFAVYEAVFFDMLLSGCDRGSPRLLIIRCNLQGCMHSVQKLTNCQFLFFRARATKLPEVQPDYTTALRFLLVCNIS